jgi:hypothetical protein
MVMNPADSERRISMLARTMSDLAVSQSLTHLLLPRRSPADKDISTKAEESQLLEAAT